MVLGSFLVCGGVCVVMEMVFDDMFLVIVVVNVVRWLMSVWGVVVLVLVLLFGSLIFFWSGDEWFVVGVV